MSEPMTPEQEREARAIAMEWAKAPPGLLKAVADDLLMDVLCPCHFAARVLARRLKTEALNAMEAAKE